MPTLRVSRLVQKLEATFFQEPQDLHDAVPPEGLNNEEERSKSEFGMEREGMGREEERREGRDRRKEKGEKQKRLQVGNIVFLYSI